MDPTSDARPSSFLPFEPKHLFLDCLGYQEDESPPRPNHPSTETWIGAETSDGTSFHISLRTVPPPGFSTLHLDGISSLDDGGVDNIEAVASCCDTILMHTAIKTGTMPCFRRDYYLLMVTKGAMLRLPAMPGSHELNIGILRHQQGDQYMVAVLKEGGSTLSVEPMEGPYLCVYSTSTNKWIVRPVSLPACWNWDIDMVLADGTTFWWVDLYRGILSYNVADDHQHDDQQSAALLGFIPLPSCIQPESDERENHLRDERCVGVSAGVLRCIHVFRRDDARRFVDYGTDSLNKCEDYVKVWSWRGGKEEWVEEYEMKFADLWEGKRYIESGLPKAVPEYPTIDPCCPNLVNFFLHTGKRHDGHVIGVDLASMEMVYHGEVRKGLLSMVTGLEIVELSSGICA